MPKPRAAKLETASARLRLGVRNKPYYTKVSRNIQLGYRRCKGAGSWSVRVTANGADWVKKIGLADDLEPADNRGVLSYWEAVTAARKLARYQPGDTDRDSDRPATVADALESYTRDLASRGADSANARRVSKHLTAALATKPVCMLRVKDLRDWRDSLIAKGLTPASINRTRTGLRAALELAATLDPRITNRDVFRLGLKGLPGGNNARRIVLPDTDVLRIVEAAYQEDYALGVLVQTLAETGARVGQLARVRCIDLQADRADPRLLVPTSFKGHRLKEHQHTPVPISLDLARRLQVMKGKRGDDQMLLLKGDSTPWNSTKSDYFAPFRAVVARTGLDRKITSYALRHSSICRQLIRGTPVSITARLHDTSPDEIQKHYGRHILDVGEEIARRALLAQPETTQVDNVVPLRTAT
jgi:integrase